MEMHYATIWESIADSIPDAIAIVNGDVERTWAQYDDRAARVAAGFTAAGLGPGTKIGMYLYNGNEYLEAQYAGFKLRGVPVNVNYRYLDDELQYLLDNADAEALVFHSSLGDRVARVADRLPNLKLLVEVDDGGAGQVPGGWRTRPSSPSTIRCRGSHVTRTTSTCSTRAARPACPRV
jgi:3-oxocholest-4-en-26-oate---CoA ligase